MRLAIPVFIVRAGGTIMGIFMMSRAGNGSVRRLSPLLIALGFRRAK
jgi:hypothetical protein